MSLYGGIKFSAAEGSEGGTTSTPDQPTNGDATGPSSSKPKAVPGFSAALKFAPRLNKPRPQAGPSVPRTYTAAPVIEKKADLLGAGSDSVSSNIDAIGPDGNPLSKAPAMTLAGEKRGWKSVKGADNADKRKKKKKKRRQPTFISNFNPEEDYNPNSPNDLAEYQQYRKRLRAEKRAQLVAEKMRKAAGESSEGSSYYSDSEDDAPRRDAPKLFAPPRAYSPPPTSVPPPNFARPPSPPPLPAAQSGEDAYARRAATAPAQTADEAYARRVAMSRNQAPQTDSTMSVPQLTRPPQPFTPSSAPPPPPPVMPPFAPPPAFAPGLAPPPPTLPATLMASSISPAPPGFAFSSSVDTSGIPGFAQTTIPPPVPTSGPIAPSPSQTSTSGNAAADQDDFARKLEERRAAAEAIAAKFRGLPGAPVATPAPSRPVIPKEEETGTFAEKMMKRWGHVEGTGIGARADGIVHALSTEHVQKQLDPSKMSKRQLAKAKVAAANAKKRKWVQAPSARGRIVNANEDVKTVAEKERYGEAGRVICLTGLVESEDEVDEELSDEIGEECSKWGIVERVVLHMVEPPPEVASECLRVFVVFSGMAGAWRAVKELDGRIFAGRTVRATYFDEIKFNAGDRDGPAI